MLLAATVLNVGSCWVGAVLVVEDEIKAILESPEGVKLISMVALGYSAHKVLPPVRKPLKEIKFLERWRKA
jgi:nitroreductase